MNGLRQTDRQTDQQVSGCGKFYKEKECRIRKRTSDLRRTEKGQAMTKNE